MSIDRVLNDFDRRMDEKRKQTDREKESALEKAREEAKHNEKRNQERFSRLSGAQKKQVIDDLLQPTGSTRDAFLNKYGYLPDVHGLPGSPGFEERRAKDLKMIQERKYNAKLKKYY